MSRSAALRARRSRPAPLPRNFYDRPTEQVARELLGAILECRTPDGVAAGRIVETEAYDQADPAAHTFGGPTKRNASMFGPSAHAYVYRSYGLHWCLNLVCREPGHGAGVLIRAIEPTAGLDVMARRRGLADPRLLCAGPGRVGQALGITLAHNGLPLARAPFHVAAAEAPVQIVAGPRIGISKAVECPWRFGLAGSKFVSRPFLGGARAEP